jgi:hypothetical protein
VGLTTLMVSCCTDLSGKRVGIPFMVPSRSPNEKIDLINANKYRELCRDLEEAPAIYPLCGYQQDQFPERYRRVENLLRGEQEQS